MSVSEWIGSFERIWNWLPFTEPEPLNIEHRWLDKAKAQGLIPSGDSYAWAKPNIVEELVSAGTHEVIWIKDRSSGALRRLVDPSGMVLLRKLTEQEMSGSP